MINVTIFSTLTILFTNVNALVAIASQSHSSKVSAIDSNSVEKAESACSLLLRPAVNFIVETSFPKGITINDFKSTTAQLNELARALTIPENAYF